MTANRPFMPVTRRVFMAILPVLLLSTLLCSGSVVWHPDRSRMDADVDNQPLQHVLESLATSSGWRIYLEPDSSHTVSASFRNLTAPAALQHLLGNLSYALVPDPETSARLYVFHTAATGATERIAPTRPRTPSTLIANELIVTLNPEATESIDDIANRLGAKVVGRANDLRSYRLQFEDEAAANHARYLLELDDNVESIDSNHRVQPPPQLNPFPQGNIAPLTLMPRIVPETEQIVVALLDTPIAADHPNLKDFLLPTVSLAGTTDAGSGQLTHATAMAETMLRALDSLPHDDVGTPVRILPIDIYGSSGTTTTFDVALGLLAAAQAGPAFVNLSLGTDTDSPFLHRLIQDVARHGTLIIAAAGNEPVATPMFPAAYPEVLAVTAADQQGAIAPYANYGDFVDVIGPGTALIQFDNRLYLGSGTSYATAHITGIAAGLATTPDATPADVLLFIREQYGISPSHP